MYPNTASHNVYSLVVHNRRSVFSSATNMHRYFICFRFVSYSKEEGLNLEDFHVRNFTYLLSEYSFVNGYSLIKSAAEKDFGVVESFHRLSLAELPILRMKPAIFIHEKT